MPPWAWDTKLDLNACTKYPSFLFLSYYEGVFFSCLGGVWRSGGTGRSPRRLSVPWVMQTIPTFSRKSQHQSSPQHTSDGGTPATGQPHRIPYSTSTLCSYVDRFWSAQG